MAKYNIRKFTLNEIEMFFVERYQATLNKKNSIYLDLEFKNHDVFKKTKSEISGQARLKELFPDLNFDDYYLGIYINVNSDGEFIGTACGSSCHMYFLLTILLGDNLENNFDDEEKELFEQAYLEIKDYFNV